jgi:transposase InsO family protein
MVPKKLIHHIIKVNHDSVYVVHPGVKRTYELISLNYSWPGMRNSIKDYVKMCDACQRRKEEREFVVPLGDVNQPSALFEVISMDITGPYVLAPRKNKYLLTFIDYFTKYVEAAQISEQSAETCTRVHASHIVTRHGTGSKLITEQGRTFMSTFFQQKYKILGIHKVNTTNYHPSSNGMVERLHRTLHKTFYFILLTQKIIIGMYRSLSSSWLMEQLQIPLANTVHSTFYTVEKCRYPLMTN